MPWIAANKNLHRIARLILRPHSAAPTRPRTSVKSRHQNLRSLPRLLLVGHVAVHNPVSAPRAGEVMPAEVIALSSQ